MDQTNPTIVATKRRKSGEGSVKLDNKKRRAQGKEYVNSKRLTVRSKSPPTGEVLCQCRYACNKLSHGHKLKLFTDFYDIGDNVQQNTYLMGLLAVTNVKRRRHGLYEDPGQSRRQATVYFTVPDGKGETKQVCKTTFIQIFSITRRRIETLVKAKKQGFLTYIERRGNKTKHRKYNAEDEQQVFDHIESIPKEESHYTRIRNPDKQYLSEDLNMTRLYTAFKEIHPNTKITVRYYRDTVKRKFPNLKFRKPRQDTCGVCDLLHNKMQNEPSNREQNKKKLELHHRKAERARERMTEDHENSQRPNSDTSTISVDLQQVYSLPTLTHSQMYYLRQLSCYNLGVHIGDNNQGCMFVWHEGLSGRGGNEIASCLFKGLKSHMTRKKKLVVWSDNCCGQNKNQMLLFLWILLVCDGTFDEIEHKYLMTGHSYLSCDRDFAQIEKRKRKEKCEVPLDIVRLLVHACHKKPFIATLMQEYDFFDFKAAAKKCLNTTKLEISKAHWIKVSKENPGMIRCKQSFSDVEDWATTNVFKKGVNASIIKTSLTLLETTNRIKEPNKADLKKMIPYLKEENKPFYINLVES